MKLNRLPGANPTRSRLRRRRLNVRDALSHLVTESYHLSRFLVPEMERTVEDALRAQVYDVVLLSPCSTAYIPAIRRLSDADLVLRAHNVEHALWDEVAADMTSRPKRWLPTGSNPSLNRRKSRCLPRWMAW